MPRVRIPWLLAARVGVVAASLSVIIGLVVLDPFQYLPKISSSKPDAKTKVASVAPIPVAANQLAIAKEAKPALKEAREQEPPAKEPAKETPPKAKEKQAAVKKEVKEVKESAPAAVSQPIAPASKPLELAIAVKKSTWVQVWADGNLVLQQRLRRGAEEKWTAKKRFDLIVANPSEVELVLNGTSITGAAVANKGRLFITHKGVTQLSDTPS
jgi:cytoskeletal protein RodZ